MVKSSEKTVFTIILLKSENVNREGRIWSGSRDLNSGPLAPHASVLPDCAKIETSEKFYSKLIINGSIS